MKIWIQGEKEKIKCQMFSHSPCLCRFKIDDWIYQIVMYVVSIGYSESNEIFILKYQYLQYAGNHMLFSYLNF